MISNLSIQTNGRITGIETTLPFHQDIIEDEVFMSGNFNTSFIDDFYKRKSKQN